MRKIFVSNLMSLDGYFEGPNKEIDWFMVNEQFFAYAGGMMKEVGAIMYGRLTYQFMEAYWPGQDHSDVVAERMNNLPKIVFSKTLTATNWGDVTVLHEINAEEVIKLKNQPGGDIVILGSAQIMCQLANLGLIDEYRIILAPIILGGGNPMFKGIDKRIKLAHTETKTLSNGVHILYYHPVKS